MLLPRWFLIINGVSLLLLGLTLLWVRLRPQGRDEAPAPVAVDEESVGGGLPSLRRPRVARMPAAFGILARGRPLIGVAWALLCCAVGGGLLLMAAGRVPQPGTAGHEPRPGHRAGPVFPTDR